MTARVPHHGEMEELQAFCLAHPASGLDAPFVRLLLRELPRASEHVVALRDGSGDLALVASVIDTVRSWADVAIFELLGWRGDLRAFGEALDRAERLVADGPRAAIELPVYAPMEPLRPLLEARGYRWAFSSYEMQTADTTIPETSELAVGWRWVDVDAADATRVEAYHHVVSQAFVGVPGANVGSVETLRQILASLPAPAQLLLAPDGQPAGVARTSRAQGASGRGTIDTIARAPGYRGLRLGEKLLAEAMRRLRDRGATHYGLSVAADNDDALSLYRRYGFAVVREEPSYHSPELP